MLTGQHDPHHNLAELLAVLMQISAALVVLKALVLTAVPMMHVLQLEMREMLVWKEVKLSRYVVTLHLDGTIIGLCHLRAYMSCSICRLAPVNHVTVVF